MLWWEENNACEIKSGERKGWKGKIAQTCSKNHHCAHYLSIINTKFVKGWSGKNQELAQSLNHRLTNYHWDEIKLWLHPRPHRSTAWSYWLNGQIPKLQNLIIIKKTSQRLEVIKAAKVKQHRIITRLCWIFNSNWSSTSFHCYE